MQLIDVKTLVALDMTLNNQWVIWVEMLAGLSGPIALASILELPLLWTICLVGIGTNYLLPTWYATQFVLNEESKTVRAESGVAQMPTYNNQQWVLFPIPFVGLGVALWQTVQK